MRYSTPTLIGKHFSVLHHNSIPSSRNHFSGAIRHSTGRHDHCRCSSYAWFLMPLPSLWCFFLLLSYPTIPLQTQSGRMGARLSCDCCDSLTFVFASPPSAIYKCQPSFRGSQPSINPHNRTTTLLSQQSGTGIISLTLTCDFLRKHGRSNPDFCTVSFY